MLLLLLVLLTDLDLATDSRELDLDRPVLEAVEDFDLVDGLDEDED